DHQHRIVGLREIRLFRIAGGFQVSTKLGDEILALGSEGLAVQRTALERIERGCADLDLSNAACRARLVAIWNALLRQRTLRHIAGAGEFALADRIELEARGVWIGDHTDRRGSGCLLYSQACG